MTDETIRDREQRSDGEAERLIVESVQAGGARFALMTYDGSIALLLGGRVVRSLDEHGAAIVGMLLTIENLRDLRDTCDSLLKERS